MKILQQPVKLKRHARVKVTFNRPANIFLMTEVNFKKYKEGASHKRIGGWYDKAPVEFTAPYDGLWHAIIEKGGHFNPEPITGSVEVLSPLMKDIDLPGGDWGSDDPVQEEVESPKEEIVDESEDGAVEEEPSNEQEGDEEEDENK